MLESLLFKLYSWKSPNAQSGVELGRWKSSYVIIIIDFFQALPSFWQTYESPQHTSRGEDDRQYNESEGEGLALAKNGNRKAFFLL